MTTPLTISMTAAEAEYLLRLVEEKGTGPAAASLLKKLRLVWSQREAHNVIRAMATKRERTLQKKK